MNNLKTTWFQLTSIYSRDTQLIEDYWAEIQETYSTPQRHYHNLSHLEFMIERAIKYEEDLTDPATLMFSIFYHDFEYSPMDKMNEQKSAKIAQERLRNLGMPADKITKCRNLILATKKHEENADNDIKYMLDFDLAVLGAGAAEYKIYTKKIRKEYFMVPDIIYRNGRKNVLQHFLNMQSIFKTEKFIHTYERQARINLQRELKDL